MARLRLGTTLVAAVLCCGCFAPPTNRQKVTDAARELNVNSRFGRMEMAASYAAPRARKEFLEKRMSWGTLIRVIDIELADLTIDEERGQALVEIDVSWMRIDESDLRTTRVAQVWRESDGDWHLAREKRVRGDVGLFGEQVQVVRRTPEDVQFPTTKIQ